jgi:hypothetical protein
VGILNPVLMATFGLLGVAPRREPDHRGFLRQTVPQILFVFCQCLDSLSGLATCQTTASGAAADTPSANLRVGVHKSFLTPGKTHASGSFAGVTPQRAIPGRRDLGAGTLHFWNHNTPGGGSGGAGTDSVMTGDVRFAPSTCWKISSSLCYHEYPAGLRVHVAP